METLQVALLKPGGRLVYSTCTINPEENECNVAYAPADKHMKVCVFITAVPMKKLFVWGDWCECVCLLIILHLF